MSSIGERLLTTPQLFAAAGRMFRLVGQSDDPYAFVYYCQQGEVERALDTIDRPNEEIHQEIATMRVEAEEGARSIPGFEDSTKEDLYD